MAEFCLECWNKIHETDSEEHDVVLSKDLDLCEECGQRKRVVVKLKPPSLLRALFPFL